MPIGTQEICSDAHRHLRYFLGAYRQLNGFVKVEAEGVRVWHFKNAQEERLSILDGTA